MPGSKKRSAEEVEDCGPTTRSAKSAKTHDSRKSTTKPASKGGKKGGPKANLSSSAFRSHALPLHLNITHTPPTVEGEGEAAPGSSSDPGFIGTTTLLPCSFSTGSYGWKGSKRITVELLDNENGTNEKVHVMLTVNATVMGSKNAKGDDGDEGKHDGPTEGEGVAEEVGGGSDLQEREIAGEETGKTDDHHDAES